MPLARLIVLLMVMALAIVACNRDEGESSETTVTPAAGSVTTDSVTVGAGETTTTPASSETTTAVTAATSDETATTSTTAVVTGMPSYEVVHARSRTVASVGVGGGTGVVHQCGTGESCL